MLKKFAFFIGNELKLWFLLFRKTKINNSFNHLHKLLQNTLSIW
jgi:hypothetical protein